MGDDGQYFKNNTPQLSKNFPKAVRATATRTKICISSSAGGQICPNFSNLNSFILKQTQRTAASISRPS